LITLLGVTRQELLPMVLSAQTKRVTLSIFIEERFDALIVAGRDAPTNRELGFAITYLAIVDGLYRAQMRPSLCALVQALETDSDIIHDTRPEDIKSWRIH
jgi:hypothetical protein